MSAILQQYDRKKHSQKLGALITPKYFRKYTNRLFPYSLAAIFEIEKNFLYLLIDEKKEDEIIGIIVLRRRLSKRLRTKYFIYGLEIFNKYRGRGYGSLILESAFSILRIMKIEEVFLYVNQSNIIATNLYLKFGFKKIAIRRKEFLMKKAV